MAYSYKINIRFLKNCEAREIIDKDKYQYENLIKAFDFLAEKIILSL